MVDNPIKTPLPADLPENWLNTQTIAAAGADVGLSKQHGYNYLMQQVNAAQNGVNLLGSSIAGLTPATLGAVPTTRKVNGLPLSSDINLTPKDIGLIKQPYVVIGTSTNGHTLNDCDYLCTGNDDQEKIQAAVNSLEGTGGTILILSGTYNITSSIVINNPNVCITGDSISTVLVQTWDDSTSDTQGIFYISLDNTIGGVKISNMTLRTGVSNRGHGIYCTSSYFYMKTVAIDCIFIGFSNAIRRCDAYKCIFTTYSYGNPPTTSMISDAFFVIDCSFIGRNGVAAIGIYNAQLVANCEFSSIRTAINSCKFVFNNIVHGVGISSSVGIRNPSYNISIIANNYIEDVTTGIDLYYPDIGSIVQGNTMKDCGTGIHMQNATATNVCNNSVFRGTGISSDYTASQYTIRLYDTGNTKNLVSNNLILGKNYVSDGGTGNTFVNNKYN